jgi:hypothetical protein
LPTTCPLLLEELLELELDDELELEELELEDELLDELLLEAVLPPQAASSRQVRTIGNRFLITTAPRMGLVISMFYWA